MCGIGGYAGTGRQYDRGEIEIFKNSLSHRGPDGVNALVNDSWYFCHSRLAIIDLTSGDQPMTSDDGKYAITYNGEIYNYKEIRRELELLGVEFLTNSDTEVILKSYTVWGSECLNKFRGMFAFAILDYNRNILFLARDHFGIKPLIYYSTNEKFYFSSEISSLKKILNLSICLSSIDLFLRLNYIPNPYTGFENVFKLPPGHFLELDLKTLDMSIKKYYQFEYKIDNTLKLNEWVERLDNALYESVKYHLVADVDFGVFLSGGIDSSLVLAYAAKISDRPVKSFTIDFTEKGFSELVYAKEAAAHYGSVNYSTTVGADALSILPSIVLHCGEPFGDSTILPTYFLSKFARTKIKFVLSGDGGDEFFLGYNSHKNWYDRISLNNLSLKSRLILKIKKVIAENPYKKIESIDNYLKYTPGIGNSDRSELWRDGYLQHLQAGFISNELKNQIEMVSGIQKAQLYDLNYLLPDNMLFKTDIASMMNGLEVRTPLIDIKVADMISSVPSEILTNSNEGWVNKRLLKEVANKYYPDTFIKRKKKGFTLPIADWLVNDKGFGIELERRFFSSDSYVNQYFKIAKLKDIVKSNRKDSIWSLFILDEWLKQN